MNALQLSVEQVPSLPRLGWVARIGARRVQALAGRSVEAGDGWLVEGVWPGPFDGTGFVASESFFGSGLRVEADAVVLVPSCALTDRVWLARSRDGADSVASNSLLLLLGAIGARLDDATDYRPACHAILDGVDGYTPTVPGVSDHYSVEQLYLHPVRVRAGDVIREYREHTARISDFAAYEHCLLDTVGGIVGNCHDGARRHPVAPSAAVSTGYDSTAVAALARQHGVREAWATTGAVTLDGAALEDATPVTDALDVDVHELEPRRPASHIERLCLAATYDGRESVFSSLFDAGEANASVNCLFSGYHGDKVWDRATDAEYLDRNVRRGDTSGVNLSEVRLQCGLFNVAIPFVQARSIAAIVAVANSAEMQPWQLDNDYDRPVPRRIAEARGVPREVFGRGKTQVMEYYTWPRDPTLRESLFGYLRERGFGWFGRKAYQVAEQLDYRMALRGMTSRPATHVSACAPAPATSRTRCTCGPSTVLWRRSWPLPRELAQLGR